MRDQNLRRATLYARVPRGAGHNNWPDILRGVANMSSASIPPSQLFKELAVCPRQYELALALRDVGRAKRTVVLIDWLLDANMQCGAPIGLNEGEAHHAFKNAPPIRRQRELRDRGAEDQHHQMAGPHLLGVGVCHWNTKQVGITVAASLKIGKNCAIYSSGAPHPSDGRISCAPGSEGGDIRASKLAACLSASPGGDPTYGRATFPRYVIRRSTHSNGPMANQVRHSASARISPIVTASAKSTAALGRTASQRPSP